MKSKSLFSGKIRKKKKKMLSAEIFTQHVKKIKISQSSPSRFNVDDISRYFCN